MSINKETTDKPSEQLSQSTLDSEDASPVLSSTTSSSSDLLHQLPCPQPSELARKRKVDLISSLAGKKILKGYEPKSVSPSQRVEQFPNESLCVCNNKLFCLACREDLSLKVSVIRYHAHQVC